MLNSRADDLNHYSRSWVEQAAPPHGADNNNELFEATVMNAGVPSGISSFFERNSQSLQFRIGGFARIPTLQAPRNVIEINSLADSYYLNVVRKPLPIIASASEVGLVRPYSGRLTGPVKFANRLMSTWKLSEAEIAALLGFESNQVVLVKNILRGLTTLPGRDAKDRISVLFEMRKTLSGLFRDEEVERRWLREEKDLLDGKSPMNQILSGSFENLLWVRDYISDVAGK